MQKALKIQDNDNVAVALQAIEKGTELTLGQLTLQVTEEIPMGHKFALRDIQAGEDIIKYGYSIGIATETIKVGAWVHTHNTKTGLGDILEYTYNPIDFNEVKGEVKSSLPDYFNGFRREDGKVGIRNEIWIIPTVGCVNDIAKAMERKARENMPKGIDEIIAFGHPYGCSQLGDDQLNTQKILAGLINHPNAAGVLVLGLGCENNSIDEMKKVIGDYNPNRVKFLICQDAEDEMEQGQQILQELVEYGLKFKREQIPVSELIIGLKCGGSDGFSGITANPTVGAFSDKLIAKGGTTILTEVPEMFGAEQILMNRCVNEDLFHKTVSLINDFKQYYMDYNQPIYENPSPGNKKGGITTLEDKSLGCTQKSGLSPVTGVLQYGEPVSSKGLQLLSGPGNDLVAATALAASGAHIVLFTTGRGTPFGAPVPTIKISSNTPLAEKKKGWIDFDAGRMLAGVSLDQISDELYQLVIDTASGFKIKAEENGYHDLAIFKQGVTL